MAKKTDPNRDKTSQPSGDTSCPSASTSSSKKTLFSKAPNLNQKIKIVEKIMADKTDVNMPIHKYLSILRERLLRSR